MKQLGENSLVAQGVVRIDDVNEELGIELPEDQGYDTIGGFLSHSMGRIPATGETYTFNGTTFTVLEANERRISKVKIVVAHEPDEN